MADARIRVGVLFGGRSCEHEVSMRSAQTVLSAIDRSHFDPVPIGVTKNGEWVTVDAERMMTYQQIHIECGAKVSLLPQPGQQALIAVDERVARFPRLDLDVVFPLIHGPLGEDGTVQGLLELAGLPYVGSRVLASALAMDKAMAKSILEDAGLSVTPYRVFANYQWQHDKTIVQQTCELAFPYPWFVKPARMGSSIGVSKVSSADDFGTAMENAFKFDTKVLVEAGVIDAREIEVAVIGNQQPRASLPGEIKCVGNFYDYEAKYAETGTKLRAPARLQPALVERLRLYALRAFNALQCEGMARVDFLMRGGDERVYVSEVNTVPGFTSRSMFPLLWDVSGLNTRALVTKLIDLALESHFLKRKVQTNYFPALRVPAEKWVT